MSSGGRRFYQTPPFSKYLLPIQTVPSGGITLASQLDTHYSALQTSIPYSVLASVNTVAGVSFLASTEGYVLTGATLTAGQLYVDTGRRFNLYGEGITFNRLNQTAAYTQVVPINSANTFSPLNMYAKVWAANGQNIMVVRTG